ncbi:MAG: exodeoxyribonuclease VII small subunit [Spongiibacteraceae bacterium]|jgi:exodeoxyribonuclease VII small subunit|nr:exodeoxyribonuclease VII small subunit [Spongiibacteraceae bacterium]
MAKSKKPLDFERALGELESLVQSMESGDMTLEESLQAFERGIRLTRECQQALASAEQKVELLLSEQGATAPFDMAAESADDEADDI